MSTGRNINAEVYEFDVPTLAYQSVGVIRRYEDRDREACRSLWRTLTQTHRDLYDDQTIGGDADLGEPFDAHLGRVGAERIWVADEAGVVVGFAGLIVEGAAGELEPIVVAQSARKSGIGRALVERVVAEARAAGLRRLDVRPAARNDTAIRFFHELGFDSLGQLELMIYLQDQKDWPVRARLADREFRA
jgi:N-acetylglutamate synthase-like GNAT family acetyltransferase